MGISGKVLPKSSGLMVRGVSVQTILMKLLIRIDVDIFVSVNTLFFEDFHLQKHFGSKPNLGLVYGYSNATC